MNKLLRRALMTERHHYKNEMSSVRKRLIHGDVKTDPVSVTRHVPSYIERPNHVTDKMWSVKNKLLKFKDIERKNPKQIQGMIDVCKLAREILDFSASLVHAGVTTNQIDAKVHEEIIGSNAYPSPLLYKGFPKSLCTSVNEVACHGIPDDTVLCPGDIINIDITVFYRGFHGDCSETYIVGETSADNEWLIEMTRQCRDKAIEICGPGVPFNHIGKLISDHAGDWGFEVVPAFCGHGIGSYFHGPPDIIHTDNDQAGVMAPGMTFTIEPILSSGSGQTKILEDGWTAVTVDASNAAQFEHTVLVTSNGVEILTK